MIAWSVIQRFIYITIRNDFEKVEDSTSNYKQTIELNENHQKAWSK